MALIRWFLMTVGLYFLTLHIFGAVGLATNYHYFGPPSTKVFQSDAFTCIVKQQDEKQQVEKTSP